MLDSDGKYLTSKIQHLTFTFSIQHYMRGQSYDYIIAGAGCAGLSLIVRMIRSGQFRDKKILLVDRDNKNNNDRTWCFWETTPGLFETVVYKKWEKAWFHSERFSELLQFSPSTYKLIKGIDFYNYCYELIRLQGNIDLLTGQIQQVASNEKGAYIIIDGYQIHCSFLFNSILFDKPVVGKKEYYLLQHFKGWTIQTPAPAFEKQEAILMDFRVHQQHGTTFVYVMPFSADRALVEYTLFTDKLLEPARYDDGLRSYINQYLFKGPYIITEEEFGVIPMTNYRFPLRHGNIVNIGTAGGQTKASSGYTFNFIQKHSKAIVDQLISTGKPFTGLAKRRFHFYDSVLLNILYHKNYLGKNIFTHLFKKNKTRDVLKFLDNESSLVEELKIISSLPTWPFLKAALRQL